jgi:hypothetical protein
MKVQLTPRYLFGFLALPFNIILAFTIFVIIGNPQWNL